MQVEMLLKRIHASYSQNALDINKHIRKRYILELQYIQFPMCSEFVRINEKNAILFHSMICPSVPVYKYGKGGGEGRKISATLEKPTKCAFSRHFS